MPTFSMSSIAQLQTCDIRLQRVMLEVVKLVDIKILCGHRTKEEQDKAVREGKSKLYWPKSKHNSLPSRAVDIAPWYVHKPNIDWNDTAGFIYVAGIVKGVSGILGFPIRWGGDWDQDNDQRDESFRDLVHFEIAD